MKLLAGSYLNILQFGELMQHFESYSSTLLWSANTFPGAFSEYKLF